MPRKLVVAIVTSAAVLLYVAPAEAVTPAAKPVGACALLGAAGAAKFLGGPAGIVHETNQKGAGAVLNRGCIYSSGDQEMSYTANTYSSAAMAETIFTSMAKATLTSTDNLFLQAAGNIKVAGMPGFARIHRIIPGAGETPPAKEFLYQLVVRKGATILIEEYGANDLDSTPRLKASAQKIVHRM
jgi:hypothetical protein